MFSEVVRVLVLAAVLADTRDNAAPDICVVICSFKNYAFLQCIVSILKLCIYFFSVARVIKPKKIYPVFRR